MSNDKDELAGFEMIREEAIAVLDGLVEKARAFDLAEPSAELERYRGKLAENACEVLVVGEAKRGKSTFINALIGSDVLPADLISPTSQAFRVRPAEREAYRVRFEDGFTQEIGREDLAQYGSQDVTTQGRGRYIPWLKKREPLPSQMINYIEVEVPVRFLPEGISIWDTPGLGALYAGHAQITHRFVPQADAVIYVLDSDRPLGQTDVEFIEKVLSVTPNLFFIQTMIDRYDADHWREVQRRNRQILGERFGDGLLDARVWPVSSTNLRKAATGSGRTAEAYLMVSRHQELKAGLRNFLNHTVVRNEVADAIRVAEGYHTVSRETLRERLGIYEGSTQENTEILNKKKRIQEEFNKYWGASGEQKRRLKENMQKAARVSRDSFKQALEPSGDLVVAQELRIEAVKSFAEAREMAASMPAEFVNQVVMRWERDIERLREKYIDLLNPYVEDASVTMPPEPGAASVQVTQGRLVTEFKLNIGKLIRSSGLLMAGGAATSGAYALVGAGTATVGTAGLAAVPLALGALWWMASGAKESLTIQKNSARADLKKNLGIVRQEVYTHFFSSDASSDKYGRVVEYFNAIESSLIGQVEAVAKQKSDERDNEIALQRTALSDEPQRKAEAERTRQRLDEWDEMGKTIKSVSARLAALNPQSTLQTAG